MTRPLFIYLSERSLQEKPTTRAFVMHYLQGLPTWIHFTGFMPLRAERYAQSLQSLESFNAAPAADPAGTR